MVRGFVCHALMMLWAIHKTQAISCTNKEEHRPKRGHCDRRTYHIIDFDSIKGRISVTVGERSSTCVDPSCLRMSRVFLPKAAVISIVALVQLLSVVAFDVSAWQTIDGDIDSMQWPEDAYLDDTVLPSERIGMTLSGGGDRSYTASIGYLAAMHDLDMMRDVAYLVGVSGGSWATTVYTYYQYDDVSDRTMLGEVVFPEDITYEDLGEMEIGCVRGFVNSTERLGGPTYEDWADFVQVIYLDPSAIPRGRPFSYNADSVEELKSHNPALDNTVFVLPRGQSSSPDIDPRPYPIISTTLIGPYDLLPALPTNRNYTLLEFTPLSVGVAYSSIVSYSGAEGFGSENDTIYPIIGGLVEPFAFGGDSPPATGLMSDQSSGQLDVPSFFSPVTDLALASGSSSWAAGAAIAASDNPLINQLSGTVDYWAPSASSPSVSFDDYVISDGAGVSNTNLISLLQRGVTNIIAFINTPVPMQNSTHWNPALDILSTESIDFSVPAWFGEIAVDLGTIDLASYDLNNSQVFESDEWVPFVTALQGAQAVGKGNVISMKHTTVQNNKYGIKAGLVVNVVWFYLGRCLQWERLLSDEMKDLVVPIDDPGNQASLRVIGPFEKFPHYPTAVASLDNQQANLLANLAGWTVYQNKDLLFKAFGTDSDTSSSGSDDTSFIETTTGIIVLVAIIIGAIIIGLLVFFLVYRKYGPASGRGSSVRKDGSLASQDTTRESEMMSHFTGSVLS